MSAEKQGPGSRIRSRNASMSDVYPVVKSAMAGKRKNVGDLRVSLFSFTLVEHSPAWVRMPAVRRMSLADEGRMFDKNERLQRTCHLSM